MVVIILKIITGPGSAIHMMENRARSDRQTFRNEDLVLKVTTDIDPSKWDETKYEAFLDELCGTREYQKDAIRTTLRYLLGGKRQVRQSPGPGQRELRRQRRDSAPVRNGPSRPAQQVAKEGSLAGALSVQFPHTEGLQPVLLETARQRPRWIPLKTGTRVIKGQGVLIVPVAATQEPCCDLLPQPLLQGHLNVLEQAEALSAEWTVA